MTNFNPAEALRDYRRMSRAELVQAGRSPKSERFINPQTGETISRRAFENIRVRQFGYPSLYAVTKESQRMKREGVGRGLAPIPWAILRDNEMYQAFERIYQLVAGGVPLEDIHEFAANAEPFNTAMANIIRSGEWKFRPDPIYAKFGYGLTYARLGPNVMDLFNLLELDFSRFDAEKRADWLRLY